MESIYSASEYQSADVNVYLSVDFSSILVFPKNVSRVLSKCQTVWTQIRPDKMSGLIGVQTVCKTTKVTTSTERANITFVVTNSMDPNQAQRFVRPDLDPNCLTLLTDFFGKVNFDKRSTTKKKQNYPASYLVKD